MGDKSGGSGGASSGSGGNNLYLSVGNPSSCYSKKTQSNARQSKAAALQRVSGFISFKGRRTYCRLQ